jgi:hypothetical protein
MRAKYGVLISLILAVASAQLHAAACCTSATAFGTGRLLLWEKWAFGVRSQMNHELGFYDDRGRFEVTEPSVVDQQLRLDAYALYPTSEKGSVFVVVPWLFARMGRSDGISTGSNISDVQIGYRHQLIAIGEFEELPGIALTGAVLLPTGTPRLTGRDALILISGSSFEKTWMPFFAQLNLGASLVFNQIRSGRKTPDPIVPSFQVALAGGWEVTNEWVTSLMCSFTYEMPSKWKTEGGLAASYRINPNLTAQMNVASDLFLNGSGSNWPGNLSYGLGIRYGYF